MGEKQDKKARKPYLYLSLFVNLSLLIAFKYIIVFFPDIIASIENKAISPEQLSVWLPIGISFYTFQTLGYSLDVYHGHIKPERHFGIFSLFVSYFPQLVTGPIERSNRLIPQLKKEITFDYQRTREGLILMLWGFFKKIVLADRAAIIIYPIFHSPEDHHGIQVVFAGVLFFTQLYLDFSGYTDIALGSAKVLGVDLMRNFNKPYLAISFTDFWRRWHISLSTWFRDNFYRWLVKDLKINTNLSIFIMLVLIGLWHGANWTFIVFGTIHGAVIVFEKISNKKRQSIFTNIFGSHKNLRTICLTISSLLILSFTAILFGSSSINTSTTLYHNLFILEGHDFFEMIPNKGVDIIIFLSMTVPILTYQIIHQKEATITSLIRVLEKPLLIRWSFYIIIALLILNFGVFNGLQFLYFQF